MTKAYIENKLHQILNNTSAEKEIFDFIEQIKDEAYDNCKAIFAAEIRSEIFKNRNPDKEENQKILNIIGGCYTCIEIEVQKKLTRSQEGENILSIYPEIKN